MTKLNKNEKAFVEMLEEAEKHVGGELELDCVDGEWFAMDYKENLGGAFRLERPPYDRPIISDEYADKKNIDIRKCCDACGVAYVG